MRTFVSLLALATALFAPIASAQTIDSLKAQVDQEIAQRKHDDPEAWARMFGTDAADRQEQDEARSAARAYTNDELNRNFQRAVALDAGTPQSDRDMIVRTLEHVYAQKLNVSSFSIQQAAYFPQGANYVICGTATFWRGTTSHTGTFIFNSRSNGDKIVNATRVQAQVNGCFSPAGFPLTQ